MVARFRQFERLDSSIYSTTIIHVFRWVWSFGWYLQVQFIQFRANLRYYLCNNIGLGYKNNASNIAPYMKISENDKLQKDCDRLRRLLPCQDIHKNKTCLTSLTYGYNGLFAHSKPWIPCIYGYSSCTTKQPVKWSQSFMDERKSLACIHSNMK